MSKFITGHYLEKTICDIICEAEETLLIVSPYIKLDDYFKRLFDKHVENHKIHILIVFGKNENDVNRSLNLKDIDYFQKFPNISIIYVPNLHAKYYGNESKGVITSLNLNDYSFKNNIEFGVFSEFKLINKIKSTPDTDAWDACWEIVEKNEIIFAKRPTFEKKLFRDKHVGSQVIFDNTKEFYLNKKSSNKGFKTIKEIDDTYYLINEIAETNIVLESANHGYCIRTGKQIEFNPQRPFSLEAYKSWAQFKNPNYPEKYCHKTGEQSNGKTSFNNPILTQKE